jgi:hypothetical protein
MTTPLQMFSPNSILVPPSSNSAHIQLFLLSLDYMSQKKLHNFKFYKLESVYTGLLFFISYLCCLYHCYSLLHLFIYLFTYSIIHSFIHSFVLGLIKSLNPQHYIASNIRMIGEQRTGNYLAARGWP